MSPVNAFSQITTIQHGLQLLSLMQYTADFFPPPKTVRDGACFDFIIVGGGTAGCVIANRLTEDANINVLLVEAGGEPPDESLSPGNLLHLRRSKYDWNYTSEYEEIFRECHQKPFFEMFLGKMLGGTSSLNYMLYSRGHPTDYDAWAIKLNYSTWAWDNVLPYFIKHEKYNDDLVSRKDTGEIAAGRADSVARNFRTKIEFEDFDDYENKLIDANEDSGQDIFEDDIDKLVYSKPLLSDTKGSRQSTACTYLKPIKNRHNLHILKEALVTKINFDNNKIAVNVTILTNKKKLINVAARKEIIVSAGTLNTPKLLMLSGIGPEEHLKRKNINVIANLPVGNNLQDHIEVIVPLNMKHKDPPPFNPHKYPVSMTVRYAALNTSQDYPDYESISFWASTRLIASLCKFNYQFKSKICDKLQHKAGLERMGYHTEVVHLSPKSRGEVRLRSSIPTDSPVIYTSYLSEPEDFESLTKYVQDLIPLVNSTYFGSIGTEMAGDLAEQCKLNGNSREYWKCYNRCLFNGLHHYIGTCAMGTVVDSRLNVIGVKKLRIADGSVMPTIVKGDIFGPIVMIGEKVSDMIKEDHNMKLGRD